MTTDKRWLNNKWNGQNFVDSDSGLRHAKQYNPANPANTQSRRDAMEKECRLVCVHCQESARKDDVTPAYHKDGKTWAHDLLGHFGTPNTVVLCEASSIRYIFLVRQTDRCQCGHSQMAHDEKGWCYYECGCNQYASAPAALDDCDEHTGRLLLAIETMCAELRAGRANEALITGVMALGEHKARLVSHNPPTHIAELWENEKETGEQS